MKQDDKLEEALSQMGKNLRENQGSSHREMVERVQRRLHEEQLRATATPVAAHTIAALFTRMRHILTGGVFVTAAAIGVVMLIPEKPLGTILSHGDGFQISHLSGVGTGIQSGAVVSTKLNGDALFTMDGERVHVFMGDSSTVELVRKNHVALRSGTAWFSIVPNSGRFQVDTPTGSILVTGTSFAVQITDEDTTIFLSTGKIALKQGDVSIPLTPESVARVTKDTGAIEVTQVRAEQVPDWTISLYRQFQTAHAAVYFPSITALRSANP